MNPQRALTTIGIHLAVAVALIVLHFFGLIGPEPQPIWPWSPPPSPMAPAEAIELFRVARGYVSGVCHAAFILCVLALVRDFLREFASSKVALEAAWIVAKGLLDRLLAFFRSFRRP